MIRRTTSYAIRERAPLAPVPPRHGAWLALWALATCGGVIGAYAALLVMGARL